MKAYVFFLYLFFLLLGGGEYFYANTSPSQNLKYISTKFTQNKHKKILNDDQSTTIIEDTDIDIEEEYQSGEDIIAKSLNHFTLGKYSLINTLYTSYYRKLLNYHCSRFKKSQIFFTHGSPIYITQRVLRI